MNLIDLQKKVHKCDEESYFIEDKMYSDLSNDDILKYNSFHLVKAIGKLANYLEKKDHNLNIDKELEIVINQVVPDLIICAVQFSNRFNLDLDLLLENRIEQTVKKYDAPDLPKCPKTNIKREATNGEINIFEAEDPTFRKLEYAIFFNEKLKVTKVAKLYVEVFKKLFHLQQETLLKQEIRDKLKITENPKANGLRQAVPISETYFIETNIANIYKFDRIKLALKIFDCKDELKIKYVDKKTFYKWGKRNY